MQPHGPTLTTARSVIGSRTTQALLCTLILLTGCGQTGAPLAPSLELPTPVADLTASRADSRVNLKWTMPRRTTDKLPLKGAQPVHICRRVSDGPCVAVAEVSFEPQKAAAYTDGLPADLVTGPLQPLSYSIEVRNRHGRSAGESNVAFSATGTAPPPFADARGAVQSNGVLLQWKPVRLQGDQLKVNIERTLTPQPGVPQSDNKEKSPLGTEKSPLGTAKSPLVKDQTLVVRLPVSTDTGKALDPDAAPDQHYSYRISRVMNVTVAGRSIQIEGPASSEILVDTKDTFAPKPPADLAAVAAPEEGAIDLSWTPNTETDLAGYVVYRTEAGGAARRISRAAAPLDTPTYRDRTAQPGHEYAYSVTAIDRDGNESSRSADTRETLPAEQ